MAKSHDDGPPSSLDSISELDSEEEVESGTWLEEMAEEVVGNPHEAPKQTDLHRLSRSSVKCHDELVHAAQQELHEQRRLRAQHHKLRKANKQEAVQAAQQLTEAPAAFAQFSARLLRFYRTYGIEWPTVTVAYCDLNVHTKALVGSAGVPTVGNTLIQFVKDLVSSGGQTVDLGILKDVNGVLKPGTMTLLLGSPGSGKSTLLKLLSGRLTSKHLQVSGAVQYNGKDFSQFVVERTAAYVDQHDNHLPVLTVGETLEFAHACAGARPDFISKEELADVYARSQVGHMSKIASSGNVSKLASAADVAGLDGGSITTEVEGSSRQVADLVIGAGGFVHDPREEEFTQQEFADMLRYSGSSFKVELVLRLLGLAHARNTLLGSAMVRGVSGGEKKRVTTGEMLVGNQRFMAMDEISTGLDSATLYSIISFLKQSVGALQSTLLISLLQPPPEVMGLFDDIMLMDEGRIIYHGPVTDVQRHFEDVGFSLPPRMDLPSWLVEITTPAGQWKYGQDRLKLQWAEQEDSKNLLAKLKGSKASPAAAGAAAAATSAAQAAPAGWGVLAEAPVDPLTGKLPLLLGAEDLDKQFWTGSKPGRAMLEQLQQGGAALTGGVYNPRSLVMQRYALGVQRAMKLALKRQWTLFLRNKAFLIFRLMQCIIIGLIIGSLFFQVPADRSGVRVLLGGSFITIMFLAFGSAPELGLLLMNRPVWYKHRNNLFLPTYAETTSMALVRAVSTATESILFTNIVYWMMGYTRTAGAYFTYLLIMFMISLSMSALFRFIGSVAATPVHAQAFGSLGLLTLILTSGFAIIRTSIPGWWIWAYYISPFSWALRAIAINEMSAERWARKAPGNAKGLTLGEEGLDTFGFFHNRAWIWAGFGFLVGFTVLLNFFAFLALKYYSGQQARASVPDEEDLLKRRIKAEQRKQQAAIALEIKASSGSAATETALAAKSGRSLAGGSVAEMKAITLVVRDLKYFVPNPSFKGKAAKKTPTTTTAPAAAPANPAAAYIPPVTQLQQSSAAASAQDSVVVVEVQAGAAAADEPAEVPEELELLKGVNAFAEPGQLLALMGGSGAGKTTLMDVIAGRKTVGRITGDILVNGRPKQQSSWARQVGYVEQMDIHSPAATVEEALWFSGRLRLPPSVSDAQVRQRADEVLVQVDLTERHADLVGVPGSSGLPTEARKRLTIAVELVANPPVVFMDEPTSGLDARAAAIVMKAVKAVAAGGHTVMVTIHQPSINIFEAFDQLLLLQHGGRVTYFGPLGEHSKDLVHYMESVPGTAKLQCGYNPATWMLEVTGGAMATLTPANAGMDWPATYLASALCQANATQAEALIEQGLRTSSLPGSTTLTKLAAEASGTCAAAQQESPTGPAQPFRRQLLECTRKLTLAYWRMPAYNLLRLLMTVACAIVYGSMYYKVGKVPSPASIGNVQNTMGVLFSAANFLGNINLMAGMPVFGTERVVFYRERAVLMYTPLAFGFATLLAELPYIFAQTTVFVPMVYFMIGFANDAAKFWYYYLMTASTLLMMTSFGLFLVSATSMVELAQMLSGAINFLFNQFNGFTITYNSIPSYWKWANRIVPPTYAIYGLGASQLGDNHTPLVGPGLPAGTTVSSYLKAVYDYDYDFRWWALLIMVGYCLGFTILAVGFMHKSFLRR
ncbi:hypothetical protein OEZ85_004985 [Tetradesmus obliquus]|uniref:ABC transporter domain-containing protein n=1 Tax=Tetradesmus obliquus TaxID=3088 RepID=A0ABY8UJQ3_TETOB|nr:hypothetical protein OEZ85_004985 [Tetradesmus obliquus]